MTGTLCRLASLILSLLWTAMAYGESNESLAKQLSRVSGSNHEQIIKTLADASLPADKQADNRRLLKHWLNGELFILKSNGQLVHAIKEGRQYQITPIDGAIQQTSVAKRALKKIRINNRLRGNIRTALSLLALSSQSETERLSAAKSLTGSTDNVLKERIEDLLNQEQSPQVRDAFQLILATFALQQGTIKEKINATHQLSDSDNPQIHTLLTQALDNTSDSRVETAIQSALDSIEQRRQLYGLVENTFFGLSLGSVLLLSAIGLAITFGVMGVINMAHGEMIMLGAYTTFVVQSLFPGLIDQSLFIAIPLAFLVACSVGILIERTVIRHLYGRPLETLLATFGISLILQQAVRTIFSPLNQSVATPSWMSGTWVINEGLSITLNRICIIGFSLLVFAGLLFVLRHTRLGLNMRAVTQDRSMAGSMGIRTGRVDALTFGLGSGIAGIAGVALSQLTNVGPNLGQNYIIDSFMVVVFGGVGNLWGTFVAAMGLGVVNKFLEPWAGAVVAKILVLVFIILFIQKRPRGLFALKGRAVEG